MHVRLASTEFDERCNLLCQWCRDSQVRLVSTQYSAGYGVSVRESKGDVTVIPRLTVSSQSEP